jgi:hypothetical protein
MMSSLQDAVKKHPNVQPLYYVWDYEYYPPEKTSPDRISIREVAEDRLDEEGRVKLPWKRRERPL